MAEAHPRVAVVGAGAMGSIFGAAFADSGAETVFVDVSASLVDHLDKDGLVIRGADGRERTLPVRASTDPRTVGTTELVLVLVKCYHTDDAARLAAPLVGPDTIVATLQNGIGNGDVLARYFPASQLVVGVTYDSGTVLAPGHVAHTYAANTLVGPYAAGGSLEGARWIARRLKSVGFDVTATSQVQQAIWEKLVMTAATLPTAALTRLTSGALGEPGAMLDLVERLAHETIETARAAGYELDCSELLTSIRDALVGDGKASMLQDIEGGRQTEIAVVNGAVVRTADALGLDVPLNRAMVALIEGFERAHALA